MIKALRRAALNDVVSQLEAFGFAPRLDYRPYELYRQQGDIRQKIRLIFIDWRRWDHEAKIFYEDYSISFQIGIRYEPLHRLVRESLHLKRDVFGEETLFRQIDAWVVHEQKHDLYFEQLYIPFAEALQRTLGYFDAYPSLEIICDELVLRTEQVIYYDPYPIWAVAAAYLAQRPDLLEAVVQKTKAKKRLYYPNNPYVFLLARILRERFARSTDG